MSRAELAANLFRITQTEERIKHLNVHGQEGLEATHYEVGSEVRQIVKKSTGVTPEKLPVEKNIPEIHKELKTGYKKMLKEDKPKKSKRKKKK
jgi:DNA-damage-inducible protein D